MGGRVGAAVELSCNLLPNPATVDHILAAEELGYARAWLCDSPGVYDDVWMTLALAAERNAAGFVLGLPLNMDGTEGPRAQSARAFARNFEKLTPLPIGLWDERLSTAAVERDLIEADVSRAKRALVIDQHAAAFILQGALDRLARLSRS